MRPVRFFLNKNGSNVNDGAANGSSGSFELNAWGDLDDPIDVYSDVGPREAIQLQATNLDVNSGYLVEARLWGWTYDPRHAGPGDGQRVMINRQIGPGGAIR
jgi:hypothetical protein